MSDEFLQDLHKVKNYFVNSRGVRVDCLPVRGDYIEEVKAGIRTRFQKAGEPVEPPFRYIETLGGSKIKEILDETNVRTDEEKAQLEAHLDALRRMNAEEEDVTIKVLCVKGIKLATVPKEWVQEQEYFGVDVPTNFNELKVMYAKSDLLATAEDVIDLYSTCITLGNPQITEEKRLALKARFLGTLAKAGGEADTAGEIEGAANGTGLDLQPAVSGDQASGEVWEVAGGVPELAARTEG